MNLFDQIANRPQDIAKGRYSLGEEAAGLGTDAGTDALVFVQSYSYSRWAERQMSMRISFVDPRSGKVLVMSELVLPACPRSYPGRTESSAY